MPASDVLKRTKITFIRDLSPNESLGLLEYILINLPGSLRGGKHSQYFNMDYLGEGKGVRVDEGTSNIIGTLVRKHDHSVFSGFNFEHSHYDTSKLSAFQFDFGIDVEHENYRPETIKLWDDVRRIIGDYFSANPE